MDVRCDGCGREEGDPARLLAWSSSVERGETLRFCDSCSREHLRSMEAKLDREHW